MVTKWGESSNFTAKNIPLTFQMEQNGMFQENSKYNIWILHKKMKLSLLFIYLFILVLEY